MLMPLAFESSRGPSSPPASRAKPISSALYSVTSNVPCEVGRCFQPTVPSKTRTERWPSPRISKRVAAGRRNSSRNGCLEMPPGPDSMWPVQVMVWILCQGSAPPRAAAWRSRICCTVSSAPAAPPAVASAAPVAVRPSAPAALVPIATSATTPARNHAPSGLLGIGESGVIQRRVCRDTFDRDFLGFRDTLHARFLQMRNHQALLRLVVTQVHRDRAQLAIQPARRAVHFELEKTLAVDPHLPNLAVLARHLELIGGVALDLVGAGQFHLGALARVVDQITVNTGFGGGLLELVGAIGFPLVSTEVGAPFPALDTVIHLHGGLAVEIELQAGLQRPLEFESVWQLHFFPHLLLQLALGRDRHVSRATGAHLPFPGHGLDRLPGGESAARGGIALDNLLGGQWRQRRRASRCGRRRGHCRGFGGGLGCRDGMQGRGHQN